MNGHRGYTGSIAEKDSFIIIFVPKDEDIYKFVDKLIDEGDERINDKWGPAGACEVTDFEKERYKKMEREWPEGQKSFIFFGWTSS